MHAPRPDVRQSPSLEHPPPPPAGYAMPYPPVDPAQQPAPSPTVAPMLKGEDLYERVGQVGEGTYGKVYKARNKQTGEYVALKRIRMETEKDGFPITAMREIKLLQSLNHRYVVSLKELMVSKGAVYMVFEYMDHDLTGILAHPNLKFRPEHVKCLMKQLLEGLGFLHHKGVLHRDIKGSNLLVNKLGELKLADFGLARVFQKNTKRDYTNRVITLWYRPPELILGATAYGPEVDMWSAGCIMVELFTRRPIFQGHNEIMQLDCIWKTMGTPQKETWPGVDQLPWYELIKHVNSENRSSRFREMFSKYMSPAALDLAEALLSLNPKKRPTAAESLANFAYFTEEEPAACLPEDLPKIEGDWHEYESKQRKKANARPKDQQHSTQPPQPSRQPSDEIHSDHTEQDKQSLMSGSSSVEPSAAVIEQVPDAIMSAPKIMEHEFMPPAVSPSYLPYSSVTALPRPSDARAADYRGAPPQVAQPPQPYLPPPPPPIAPPTYGNESLAEQQHTLSHSHDAALNHGAAPLGRYHNPSGAYDSSRADHSAQPPGPTALSSQPVDSYMTDAHRRSVSIDESRRSSIPPPSGPDHGKSYHGDHGCDYYQRSHHYDYARDRDRNRDRDRHRERERDYGRRRGDYRREWSRDRERDRGSNSGRERDRDYDRYRDRPGRDYERDRERVRDRSHDDEDYYHRDRVRERERDGDRGRDRERERPPPEYNAGGGHDHEYDRTRSYDVDRDMQDRRIDPEAHSRRRERSEGAGEDEREKAREDDLGEMDGLVVTVVSVDNHIFLVPDVRETPFPL
ncbi:kinase subunit of RNA polymerase II carboxy-terminal domain kinase I [Mortierella alpina]|uniref:[RNA-polymerase]-subunit kinase n=1 Tax=Mortierella alpina TaxID=64518 RepID=A0A9P6IZ57_MORAP|nr:kinase subunit of RNA polymerase II carboxy-terminal domain kinase I [Mortierella alpina]